MCLITSAPPEEPVVRKKVVYTDAPRRSSQFYDPAPRTAGYPSTISPRSSVTRTVYTEPIKERSYARGSYGDIDRVESRVERSYAGSHAGSYRDLDRRSYAGSYAGSRSELGPPMGEREMVGRVYVERPRGSSQASVVIVDETASSTRRGSRSYY